MNGAWTLEEDSKLVTYGQEHVTYMQLDRRS